MKWFSFLEFGASGQLVLAVSIILIMFVTTVVFFMPPHRRASFERRVRYWLHASWRFAYNTSQYIATTVHYLYARYYMYSYAYFFFNKLAQIPLNVFIRIIGDATWQLMKQNVIAATISISTMLAFSFFTPYVYQIPSFLVWLMNKFRDMYGITFTPAEVAGLYYKHKAPPLNTVGWTDAFWFCYGTLKNLLIICYKFVSVIAPFVIIILAVSVFFWALYTFWFGFVYTKFITFSFAFRVYCYRKALVFAKSSLLFVPTSAVFFKKRRYWASDEEVSLQEEYRKGTLTKSPNTFDTIFDGAEFHQTVLQQKQLMGETVPSSPRVLAFDSLSPSVAKIQEDRDFMHKRLVGLYTQQKHLPFALIGSDSLQGVSEKTFVKLMWVNDLVLNKEFVNRLNYSSVFNEDPLIVLDASGTQNPLSHVALYQQSTNTPTMQTVSSNLKISIRNEIISPWTDLDYDQYLRQFVLNRVFNKLKFSGINGVGSSTSQHVESGVGTRTAVYKVYTPELLSRDTTSFLNNPFVNSDIYPLYASGTRSQKGRTVPLGKLTDIVLLLKSLRIQYQTLCSFTKPNTPILEQNYNSVFFINKLVVGGSLLTLESSTLNKKLLKSSVAQQFMDFNATSPFSFLPYSHVHHIVYETRPDRFYLLPASLDLVIRPFLNRLLLRYVKQLKLNSFFLVQPKNLLKQQSKQRKSELNGSVGKRAEALVSCIEYTLYKFFANTTGGLETEQGAEEPNPDSLKNYSVWSKIPTASFQQEHENPYYSTKEFAETNNKYGGVRAKTAPDCLKNKESLNQFLLYGSLKKAGSLLDTLSTFDELFSSFDFSVFNSHVLRVTYKPLYSSLLKLLKYRVINGNADEFQTHAFSLFYEVLQSSVLKKHFKGFNSFSAKLHLLLLWRTVLKSVRDSFIFFSPKVFLQRSYSYLKATDQAVKIVGGLSLEKRYSEGFLGLGRKGFLHKFTAVYNRNLLSFNINQLVDTTHPSDFLASVPSRVSLVAPDTLKPNIFVDKCTARFIWWWLDRGVSLRLQQTSTGQSIHEQPFTFISNRFSAPFFVELKAGTSSLETINFAALSYDPTGSLGATAILPNERFLTSSKILAIDDTFRDVYSVLDFVPQYMLRKNLRKYAGDDSFFNAGIKEEAEEAEKDTLSRLSEEEQEERANRMIVGPVARFKDRQGVFARPYLLNFDGTIAGPRLEPGDDDSGLPRRFWGESFYNAFLIQFFSALSYARFGRARLRHRTLGFNPLAPLLFVFKRYRSLLFFNRIKTGRRTGYDKSSRRNIKKFKRFTSCVSQAAICQKQKVRNNLRIGMRNTQNATFRGILFSFFNKVFTNEEHGVVFNSLNTKDSYGGVESQQRHIFRSLTGLTKTLSTKGSVKQQLLAFGQPECLKDASILDQKDNFTKTNVYSLVRPKLARVFNLKTLPALHQETECRVFHKQSVFSTDIQFRKRRLPKKALSFVKAAAKVLELAAVSKHKANLKPVLLTQKIKQNKNLRKSGTKANEVYKTLKRAPVSKLSTATKKALSFVKAAKLSKNYNERLLRRTGRVQAVKTIGRAPVRYGFKFETSYSVNSKPFSGLRTTVESKKSRKFKIRHKRIIVVRSRRLHPIRRVSLRRKLNRILDGERSVTAPVGPLQNQLEVVKLKHTLFGVPKEDKLRNPFASYFLTKGVRRLDYLQRLIPPKTLATLSVEEIATSIFGSKSFTFTSKEQQQFVLSKIAAVLRIVQGKKDLSSFGSYKDLLLFRSLEPQKSFIYSEHSFEESFFALLGQRSPLVKNPVLIRPISRSSLFSNNMFDVLPFRTAQEKVKTNFASITLASASFFNYVFLGKGVPLDELPTLNFFDGTDYNSAYFFNKIGRRQPFGYTNRKESPVWRALFDMLDLKQLGWRFTNKPIMRTWAFVNKRIHERVRALFLDINAPAEPRGLQPYVDGLPFRLSVKLPFFLRWPFKTTSKKLNNVRARYLIQSYKKTRNGKVLPKTIIRPKVIGRVPLVETDALRATRSLFFQSKLNFLNLVSVHFAIKEKPKIPRVTRFGGLKPEQSPNRTASVYQNSFLGLFKKFLYESKSDVSFRLQLEARLLEFLFGKVHNYDDEKHDKDMLGLGALEALERSSTYDMWRETTYQESANLHMLSPWRFSNPLSSRFFMYQYRQRMAEISQHNVIYQRNRFLAQHKKNILDFGLQFKFSPLAFDLRGQLPLRPFVRTYQLKLRQKQKFDHKKFAAQFSVPERSVGFTRTQGLLQEEEELEEFRDSDAISVNFQGAFANKETVRRALSLKDRRKPRIKEVRPHTPSMRPARFDYINRPLNAKVLSNQKRELAYKRKAFLHSRVCNFTRQVSLKIFKNSPFQSTFKRSVAAAIRFSKLTPDSYFSLLPLYGAGQAPWEQTNLFTSNLDTAALLNEQPDSLEDQQRKDIQEFVVPDDFGKHRRVRALSKLTKNNQRNEFCWKEFTDQRSVFERPSFRLAFISELITRKVIFSTGQAPTWFLDWIEKEGRLLLYRYVAYKKHNHSTVPQAHHAAVPNSSGVEKLGAAFDFVLNDHTLNKLSDCDFYQPLRMLRYVHLENYEASRGIADEHRLFKTANLTAIGPAVKAQGFAEGSEGEKGVISTETTVVAPETAPSQVKDDTTTVSETPDSFEKYKLDVANKETRLPVTTYDLLLSKAVKSFFSTKGVRRELKKPGWHKTEFVKAMQHGWVPMLWSTQTFKRANLLSFVSTKTDKSGLSLSSSHKQSAIIGADGYLYFLLLKEKGDVEELFTNTEAVQESVLKGFSRVFKLLTQQGLLAQHAGFKQALSATWVRLLKYQATTKMMANKENHAAMWPHKFATLTGWNKKNSYWSKHRDRRFFIPAYVHRRRSPWVRKLRFKRLPKSLYFDDGAFCRDRWAAKKLANLSTLRYFKKQNPKLPLVNRSVNDFQQRYLVFLFVVRFLLYKRVLYKLSTDWKVGGDFLRNLRQVDLSEDGDLHFLTNLNKAFQDSAYSSTPELFSHLFEKRNDSFVASKVYLEGEHNNARVEMFGTIWKHGVNAHDRYPHIVLRARQPKVNIRNHVGYRRQKRKEAAPVDVKPSRPLMGVEEKYAPKKKVTGHAKEFADSLYGAYTKANSTGTDLATKAPIRIRSFRKRSLFRRVFTQSQPSGVFGMPRMLRQRLVHSNVVANLLFSEPHKKARVVSALRRAERAEARTLSGNVRAIIEEPIKFLKRPYSSMLFRNPNSLRHSRWLRKGVRRVTTDFVNREEPSIKPTGIFNAIAGTPLKVAINRGSSFTLSRKGSTAAKVEQKKLFRGLEESILIPTKRRQGAALLTAEAARSRQSVDLSPLVTSLADSSIPYRSIHQESTNRPGSLMFLSYTNKFYFEQAKNSRSTVLLPSLFSTNHLTVPWEKHAHETPRSLNKRIRLANSRWSNLKKFDEQVDPDFTRHPDYTFGAVRDEFAYKENAFSYAFSNLYGLHRPVYDSLALQTVKISPVRNLYNVKYDPWWVQRYNFRRNNLNYTKININTSSRNLGRWRSFFEARSTGSDDTIYNYESPFVWLNRWVGDKRFPRNNIRWKFRPLNRIVDGIPRYRHFFRQHQLAATTQYGAISKKWGEPLSKETVLPFNFAYVRGYQGFQSEHSRAVDSHPEKGSFIGFGNVVDTAVQYVSDRPRRGSKNADGVRASKKILSAEARSSEASAGESYNTEEVLCERYSQTLPFDELWNCRLSFLDDFLVASELDKRHVSRRKGLYNSYAVCYADLQNPDTFKLIDRRIDRLSSLRDSSRISQTIAAIYKYKDHSPSQLPHTLISATFSPYDRSRILWKFGGTDWLYIRSRFEVYAKTARQTTNYLTRSNRKGFSIFFDIDESRINNYTNIRAVSSYQIVKLATVLSYGRNVEEALVEGHKQRISFLWYAISRSWSAVRADGFTGFTTYSLYHLRQSGHMLKTPPWLLFGSWTTFLSIGTIDPRDSTFVFLSCLFVILFFATIFAAVFGVVLSCQLLVSVV